MILKLLSKLRVRLFISDRDCFPECARAVRRNLGLALQHLNPLAYSPASALLLFNQHSFQIADPSPHQWLNL